MRKILIVEDDIDINNLLKEILNNNNYKTESAFTGREALLQLKLEQFDMVLLDLMMPGLSGEHIIQEIRKSSNISIIVITAKIDKETKINVLKIGADDYIKKPFDIEELLAVIEANMRRYKDLNINYEKIDELIYKDILLNPETKTIKVKNKDLRLTPIEYEILKLLMQNPNRIFSKEIIYQEVWNDAYMYDADTINAHISNLRNKIKKLSNNDYIETIWGMGYRMK